MSKELVKAPEDLSVWESNMKELERRQPWLAACLKEYVEAHGHEFEHYEETTPAGRWVSGLTSEPFFDPAGEPKFEWSKKSRETPFFFQYGAGLPPYLFKSIRALPKDALSVLVVEPNVALIAYTFHLTHVYLAMPANGGIFFLTSTRELPPSYDDKTDEEKEKTLYDRNKGLLTEALERGMNVYGVFTVSAALVSSHKGEEEAMDEPFKELSKNIREWAMIRLQSLGNSAEDTMLGLRQMSLMTPWISFGYQFTDILNDFRDKPFVVVSAGPSLDKNIELLRGIEDKCVILANDATLRKMLALGIKPHIVCALERGLPTYDLLFAGALDEHPEECSEILLIVQSVCTPKIYGRWPGPKIIVGKSEIPLDQWFVLGTIGGQLVTSGSSVAHTCLGVAHGMGASSIALIGQDLAYGEDGTSHAGGVFEGDFLEGQSLQKRGGAFKIPGALGGEVFTSELWLSFLRHFENLIRSTSTPIYDCTEGGALIRGTVVTPFADYIDEHISNAEPLELTPAAVSLNAGVMTEKAARRDLLMKKIDKSRDDMDDVEGMLRDLSELIEKTTAAALTPERRRPYAERAAQVLDELHRMNPMFAFVSQSYVYVASLELSRTRFLDSVDVVERWAALHREIVDAHTSVLGFVRRWLDYSAMALDYYAERDIPLTPPAPDEAADKLDEVIETLGGGDDQAALRMEMDALFASVDMARLMWPGETLWKCAMFLLQEGRAEEAGVMMRAAADDFEDMEMPVDRICSFLKDLARVLITHDLCYIPRYHEAEAMLNNAIRINGGMDDEMRALRKQVSRGQIGLFSNVAYSSGDSSTDEAVKRLYVARARADDALSEGDVMQAMNLVWEIVLEFADAIPDRVAPYLSWLVHQMVKFFGSLDEPYKSGIDYLLDEIVAGSEILSKVRIALPGPFVSALMEHGLEMNFEMPESPATAEVPAGETGEAEAGETENGEDD